MLLSLFNVVAGFLRRTWLVAAVTIIVCASFAARAVAAFSDAALAPGAGSAGMAEPSGSAAGGAAVPAPPAPRLAAAAALAPSGAAFVQRNIFCSSCAPAEPSPGAGGGAYQGHPAVLIATSLGAEPRATLRVVPTEVQGSWGLGEEIPGVGRLDEIQPTEIEVSDAAGHTTRISLLAPAAGAGPDELAAATSSRRPAPRAERPDPFAGRITKLGETAYEVERALVRELVTSASKPGMGGATPVVVDGDVKGIRLFGMGPASPGRALGLRSGDVISSIDGVPLKNAQQLIDLFARLDQVPSVELGGTRGGQPLQRTLKLR